MQGCMLDFKKYRRISRKRNFIKQTKALIFLEAVLAIEMMQEPRSNLEEKGNPNILKDDFSSRPDPSIFTSIAPVLLDGSNKTIWILPTLKSKSHFLPQKDQVQVEKSILVVATDQMPDDT